jgi:ATP-dependent Clp protease ATP-binding subunit ClpX
MAKTSTDKCSFCGRSRNEVELLISGISAHICEECAERAHSISKEIIGSSKNKQFELKAEDLPKPKEIKAFWIYTLSARKKPKNSFPFRFTTIIKG